MASLEQDPKSKRYRLRFRFAGQGCKRSLGTANKREAIASQVRFEETLRLVESGRLALPLDTDPIDFLLYEGRSTSTKTLKLVTLGQLLDSYQQDFPPGAKEESTLYTEGIHLRHLKRLLKVAGTFVRFVESQGPASKQVALEVHIVLGSNWSQCLMQRFADPSAGKLRTDSVAVGNDLTDRWPRVRPDDRSVVLHSMAQVYQKHREIYFRTIKSGCRIEERQFETLDRLIPVFFESGCCRVLDHCVAHHVLVPPRTRVPRFRLRSRLRIFRMEVGLCNRQEKGPSDEPSSFERNDSNDRIARRIRAS